MFGVPLRVPRRRRHRDAGRCCHGCTLPGGYLVTSLYAARVLVAPTRLSQALTAASCCCTLCVTRSAHKVVTASTPLKAQPARCGSLLIGSRWHRLAERLFVRAGAPADRRPCDAEMAWSLRLLPPECPLFARKFPANTSERARGTLLRCVGMSGGPPGHACGAAHRTVCVLLVSAPLVTGQPEQPEPALVTGQPAQRQWPLTLLLYAPVKQARLLPPWPQQQSRQTQVARPASRMSRNLSGANRPTRAAGWTSGAGCSRPGRPCRSLGRTRRPVLPCSTSSEQEQPSLSAALTLRPWSVTRGRGYLVDSCRLRCCAATCNQDEAPAQTVTNGGGLHTGVRCLQRQSAGISGAAAAPARRHRGARAS